ncbi:uncharacterized protein V1513DRAFT_435684 [Lipomyces chichibuensis]|uniref:uncharacterized protein n=1 Tax=Lipomyces chichibuensis TaxID=1546026 RepID=UPI0033436A74
MSVRDIESFPIQKHSYCKVPFNNGPSSKSIPWTHSPYRDSLVIAFDPTVSEIVRIKVMWRSEILENVDVAAIGKLNLSQSPLTVIVRSPCIGIKYAYREQYGQIMIRRFQIRFANDELFAACLRQFEKYGCLIKGASGLSSMSGSPSMIGSTQQSAASVTEGGSQSASSRSYLPSSLTSIPSYGSQYLTQSEGNIGNSPNVSGSPMTLQPDRDAQLTQTSGAGTLAAAHAAGRICVTPSLSKDVPHRDENMGSNAILNDNRVLSQPSFDSQWKFAPAANTLSAVHSTAHTSYLSTPREYESNFTVANALLNTGPVYRQATDVPIIPRSPPRITTPLAYSPSKSTDSSYVSASNTSTNTIDSPVSRTENSVRDDSQKSLKMPTCIELPRSSAEYAARNIPTLERKRNTEDIKVAGLNDKEIEKMIVECLKDPTFTILLDQVSRVLKTSNP